jgi:hypothetical protein
MDMTDTGAKVHNVPVPERHLSLVYQVLADAHKAEAAVEKEGYDTRAEPPFYGTPERWTELEVTRLYRESTHRQRAALEYLAEHPDVEVRARELACAVYPDSALDEAEGKLYGVLGSFGRRSAKFGKPEWFFHAYRERLTDGRLGKFVYKMLPEQAAWIRRAAGHPDPE